MAVRLGDIDDLNLECDAGRRGVHAGLAGVELDGLLDLHAHTILGVGVPIT